MEERMGDETYEMNRLEQELETEQDRENLEEETRLDDEDEDEENKENQDERSDISSSKTSDLMPNIKKRLREVEDKRSQLIAERLKKTLIIKNLTRDRMGGLSTYSNKSLEIIDKDFELIKSIKGVENLSYKGRKVTKYERGVFSFLKTRAMTLHIEKVKNTLKEIEEDNKKTLSGQIYNRYDNEEEEESVSSVDTVHENLDYELDIMREADNVLKDVIDEIVSKEEIKNILSNSLDTQEEKLILEAELENFENDLIDEEEREIKSILHENIDEVTKNKDETFIERKKEAYLVNYEEYKKKAEEERDPHKKELYEKLSKISLKDSEKCNLKLNKAILDDILDQIEEENQELGDLSRLKRLKRFVLDNKLMFAGGVIAIASFITGILTLVRKGVNSAKNVTTDIGNYLKKLYDYLKRVSSGLASVVGPLFTLIGNALTLGAQGIGFLANNLWALALFFGAVLYTTRTASSTRKK